MGPSHLSALKLIRLLHLNLSSKGSSLIIDCFVGKNIVLSFFEPHSRLSETRQSEGQSRQNPIQAYKTHQSISLNGVQRPEQFWYNYNIVYLSGLQSAIRTY